MESPNPTSNTPGEPEKETLPNNNIVPPTPATSVKYAGFWIRVLASIIDSLIIGVAVSILLSMLGMGPATGFNNGSSMVNTLVTIGYMIYMTYKFEATLGKKALGLKVVSADNNRLSLGQVILRETVGKIVSAIILMIGFIMVAFSDKKQGLHDKIANTLVIHNK